MKNNIEDINGWLYHRIRMCIWKQWKKPKTKMRNLMKMGIPKCYAHMAANSRKGHWFCANLTTVKRAMSKERLINSGFYDLATAYQSVHVNYWKRRIPNGMYGAVRGRELVTPLPTRLYFPNAKESFSWLKQIFEMFHCFSNSTLLFKEAYSLWWLLNACVYEIKLYPDG